MPAAAVGRRAHLLLRDFIAARLTAPAGGYFASPALPVGQLAAGPIPFADLPGRAAYREALAQAYVSLAATGAAWLTPAELFTPHYGAALARWMLEDVAQGGGGPPLREIVEVGGGTGTLARDVLTAVRSACPATYRSLTYTSIDVSAGLSAAAAAKIAAAGHGERHRSAVGDARSPAAWPPPPPGAPGRTIILACEVLDNLPHDRVRADGREGWEEAVVECEGGASDAGSVPTFVAERHRPATDPLIRRVLDVGVPWVQTGRPTNLLAGAVAWALGEDAAAAPPSSAGVWLPTGALALFDAATAARPHHTLLAADFDALPGVVVPGAGAPLVATTTVAAPGAPPTTVDLPSLYAPPPPQSTGATDIFFPTDFPFLARLYQAATRGRARHCSSADFFRAVLGNSASPTATLSGWDPLVDDFENTSVLVGRV